MFEESATEWPLLPLSEFIQRLDAGVSVNSEDRPYGAGEVGVLKTSALSGSAFDANENKAVLPSEQRLVAEPVSGNSILISRMNTPELVGVACYVRHPYPDLFLPDRIWQAKKKNGCDLDMRWLSYQLQTEGYRRFLGAHATGTSGSMKNLPKSSFLGMKLHFPKVDEQRLIAYILDTLDTQIQKTEALIAKLEKVKEGLLHDLLTRGIDENGQLRPSPEQAPELYKESPLGLIPREWSPNQLGNLINKERPIVYGILMPGYGWPDGIPVVKVKDIKNGEINKENLLLTSPVIDRQYARSKLKEGDLLFTIRGTVGRTAIVPLDLEDANITQDTARISLKEDGAEFIRHYLSMPAPKIFIDTHTIGVAVKGINLGEVRKIPVPEVPEPELAAITSRISSFLKRLQDERASLYQLNLTKAGLMDDLLTGRVRVTPLLEQAQATTPA